MLINYGGEFPFKMTDLYDKLELSPSQYNRWTKANLLESFYIELDYEAVLDMMSSTPKGGKLRQEYRLTRRTAEELALLSRTQKGKELRKWLLDLKDKVESNELLTLEQVYFLIDLVNAFSFVAHQKAIEESHKQSFINNYIDEYGKVNISEICSKFNYLRNEILDISPDIIKERILRFYDEEKRLVNKKTKREVLAVIDKFSLVGNAAFDFMASIQKPLDTASKVGEMVKGMATRLNIEIRDKNEADLFNDEIKLNPTIMQKVNPFIGKPKLDPKITKKLK
jgi:phage anti-repressor protein